jgi:hypothetical protein
MSLRKIEFATDAAGTDATEHSWVSWSDTEIELGPIDFKNRQISEVYFRVTSPTGVASSWFGPIDYIGQMTYRLIKEATLDNEEIDLNFNIINEKPEFGVEELPALIATGGTVSDIDVEGTAYRVHTFTESGTLEVSSDVNVEYLIVAGGGGGGANHGGGGGAGGLLTGLSTVSANSYAVTVGAGGSGGVSSSGENGGNSSFNSIEAIGGGGGGARDFIEVGLSGGSGGGGAGAASSSGGSGTTGQGFAGGAGVQDGTFTHIYGGGGGGASEVGTDATTIAGIGGDGIQSSITGNSLYYAGGGGGGAWEISGGAGGLGGGGTGGGPVASVDLPTAGEPNTGGGGGGGHRNIGTGAAGGSGIVIVRYPLPTTSSPSLLNIQSNISLDNTRLQIVGMSLSAQDQPDTPIQLTYPAGEIGDLLVACGMTWPSDLNFVLPSGWALVHQGGTNSNAVFVIARLADSTLGGTIQLSWDDMGKTGAFIYRIRNHNYLTSSDLIALGDFTGTVDLPTPALSGVAPNSLLISGIEGWYSDDATPGYLYVSEATPPIGFIKDDGVVDGDVGTASAHSYTIEGGNVGPFQWGYSNVYMKRVSIAVAPKLAITVEAPTGTPVGAHKILLRIKDDGTARSLTWDPIWRGIGLSLPTMTTANKTMYIGATWNSADSTWDVTGLSVEL